MTYETFHTGMAATTGGITCGEKGAKCTVNFSGSRLGKVEWHKGKKVECVEVIFNKGK